MTITQVKEFGLSAVQLFNNHNPTIKNLGEIATIAFGIIGAGSLCKDLGNFAGSYVHTLFVKNQTPAKKENHFVDSVAKVSLILSALVSQPNMWFCSKVLQYTRTKEIYLRLFGPATNFVINPKRAYQVTSLIALAFTVPSACRGALLICKNIYELKQNWTKQHIGKGFISVEDHGDDDVSPTDIPSTISSMQTTSLSKKFTFSEETGTPSLRNKKLYYFCLFNLANNPLLWHHGNLLAHRVFKY